MHEDLGSRLGLIALVALLVVGAFGAGYLTSPDGMSATLAQLTPGVYSHSDENIAPDLNPLQMFWDVRLYLLNNYVHPVEDRDALTYGAIQGMVSALNDPFSRFLTPEEYRSFLEDNRGTFVGIGAILHQKTNEDGSLGLVYVVSIIPEGPASESDLRPGDQILAVDEESMDGKRTDEVVKYIKGFEGVPVTLVLLREGQDEPVEVTIVRRQVDIPTVESEMLEGGIGYVWLRSFNQHATSELREEIAKLLDQDAQGLVLDLSLNGGGLLSEAISIGSLFFEDGPIVYVQNRRPDNLRDMGEGSHEPVLESLSASRGLLVPEDLPVVVIVDPMSASASEIVAGALQDRGRAKVIGQATFGKSKVQTVFDLDDGSALILTTALYLTPNKRDIGQPWADDPDKRGLRPDRLLPDPDPEVVASYSEWHPQQIEEARKYLLEIMATEQVAARVAAQN
jgi:carboxyl-terminal processing protease